MHSIKLLLSALLLALPSGAWAQGVGIPVIGDLGCSTGQVPVWDDGVDQRWECGTGSGTGDVVGGSTSTVDDIVGYSATGGKTVGNFAGGLARVRPHATLGAGLVIQEGADDGTNTATFKAPDSGLSATIVHTLTAAGLLPNTSVDLTTGAFNINTTGDVIADDGTFDVLTYASAVSTCTGLGCGSQLPLVTGTPSNADSGTLKLYNDDSVLAFFNSSGLVGNIAYTSGAAATDNALVRFDSTTGELMQVSDAILDDNEVLSGITLLSIGAGSSAARGIQLGQETGTPPAAAADTFRIFNNTSGLLSTINSSSVIRDYIYGLDGTLAFSDNSVPRWNGATVPEIQSSSVVIDDSGGIATSTNPYISIAQHATNGGKVRMSEGTDTGTGTYQIGIGTATNLTDGSLTSVRIEQIARVGVGTSATTTYGSPVRVISDGSAMDTGTEVCAKVFSTNDSATDNGTASTCEDDAVVKYGTDGATAVEVQDCADTVTSGHVFDVLCTVP